MDTAEGRGLGGRSGPSLRGLPNRGGVSQVAGKMIMCQRREEKGKAENISTRQGGDVQYFSYILSSIVHKAEQLVVNSDRQR